MATSVILTVCLLILLWLSVSYVGMQRSLRWWQARQSIRRCHQAEGIRDGALQNSFAMRRSLELALTNPSDRLERVEPSLLAKIETIQQALETLSNHLSPPYLDDNLPLAVRFLLEQWHKQYPNLSVEVIFPDRWCQQSGENSRIVLMALDELLRITLPKNLTPTVLHANVRQQDQVQELIIQVSPPNLSNWDEKELSYLKQAFHCLTSGRLTSGYFYPKNNASKESPTVIWHFCWRSHPGLFPLLSKRT